LPAAASSPYNKNTSLERAIEVEPKKKASRVLVIEDEPDILELIRETLSHENYELLSALDGQTGWEMATTRQPDLILLDIMIPKLNGYEICRRLKAQDKTARIPVLMLTAFGQKREIEEGFKVKADDYIVKPFEPRKLQERVRWFLSAGRRET